MALRLLGTATTNSDGKAVFQYTGTGAGMLQVKAGTEIDGSSIVSETLTVWDTLFYDTGLNDTAIWNTNNKFDKTITSNGTRITCKTGETWASMTPKQANYSFTIPFKITFNLVDVNQLALQFSNIGGGNKRIYLYDSGEYTIEVKLDGVFVNGTKRDIGVPTDNTSVFVMQIVDETKYAVFKDLKIFKGDGLRWIALNGNKRIIQSTETATLTAKLLDSDGTPMTNKNLDLYKNGTFVDSYTTDNNGVVSYTYTGVGDGEIGFQFRYDSIQSEPYPVLDALFYDEGTSSTTANPNWVDSGSIATRESDGTLLNNTTGSNQFYRANKPNTTTSDYYDWNPSFAIEFDVVSIPNASSINLYLYDQHSDTTIKTMSAIGVTTNSHVKVTYDGNNAIFKVNDVTTLTIPYVSNYPFQIAFRLANNTILKIKNFKIYSI